jgi:hypothetical protein
MSQYAAKTGGIRAARVLASQSRQLICILGRIKYPPFIGTTKSRTSLLPASTKAVKTSGRAERHQGDRKMPLTTSVTRPPNYLRLHRLQRRSILANSHRSKSPMQIGARRNSLRFVQLQRGTKSAECRRCPPPPLRTRVASSERVVEPTARTILTSARRCLCVKDTKAGLANAPPSRFGQLAARAQRMTATRSKHASLRSSRKPSNSWPTQML